jgi:hypothetical protein
LAVGDVNGDGKPDVVTSNYNGNSVSVLLGNGAGGFGTKTDFPVVTGPLAVTIADLNGDGRADLVSSSSTAVTLLLGNGTGQFGAKTDFAGAVNPRAVAIGDLNGDGKPDLAVGNVGANTVSVFLGDGIGGFGARTDYATGVYPFSVAIGDVNGDGKPDLAVAVGGTNGVSVLLGNGAGGFGAKTDYPTGLYPQSVVLKDLNGDGVLDLEVANYSSNSVSVLLGNGSGGFGAKTDFATGTNPYSVAVGDVNGDGKPDVVVANFGSNTVSVLLGDGTGNLGTKADFATGANPQSVAVGDVNGDGKLDIVAADNSVNTISVLLGNGSGGFGTKTDFTVGATPFTVAIADVNGDGRPDVVTANFNTGNVSVLLGNGAGGFGSATNYGAGAYPAGVVAADLNGDGRLDLVTPNYGSNSVSVLLGMQPTKTALSVTPASVVSGSLTTLSASVSLVAPGSGTPTGSVRFWDGTTLLGTSTLNGGSAALAMYAPYLGDRTLTAEYVGDGKRFGGVSSKMRQRVAATAAASISGIADVPGDQGGSVRLTFGRSPFDYSGSGTPITGYQVYRRSIVSGASATHAHPERSVAPNAVEISGWDFITTVPATNENAYQLTVPTLADSNGSGFHRAVLFVRAATATPGTFYDSPADSGWSVDNLPPAPPAPFTAAYAAGATHLHWGANSESDLWYYALYRGGSAGFVPGPGNLVANAADTGYVDSGPSGSYYKLAAVDVNGNVSTFALVTPTSTLSVDGTSLPTVVSFATPRPNPAMATTTLRFGLPSDALVAVRIYDIDGRWVRTLASGPWPAGEHVADWDLRDGSGRAVAGGVYFARFEANGVVINRRLTVIR